MSRPIAFRAVRGLASALVTLIAVVLVLESAVVVVRWLGYLSVSGRYAGTVSSAEYNASRDVMMPLEVGLWLLSLLLMFVSWIVLVVWMLRARGNAQMVSPSPHHLSTPWAFWGWVVPVVSLWFPPLFLHDIAKASSPQQRGTPLVPLWWITWIAAWLTFWTGTILTASGISDDHDTIQTLRDTEVDSLFTFSLLRTLAALLFISAGILLSTTVLKITRTQSHWTPSRL
ncbi:DUF4328 domain-containing protein [Nocardia ignorata]|uniref:Uncharacterized protein DUF4328 n=1 Tax=Nocardia ignorata TaxID=145285 RepID=A0A4R6PXP2_NOCIG|nr:DUF4328 domain-containing protein [Nocardia ignorata]TDP42306.1 uncharacterized protein DUF4328 [Nocardia ignorata]